MTVVVNGAATTNAGGDGHATAEAVYAHDVDCGYDWGVGWLVVNLVRNGDDGKVWHWDDDGDRERVSDRAACAGHHHTVGAWSLAAACSRCERCSLETPDSIGAGAPRTSG